MGADTLTANGNVVNNGLFLFLAGGQIVLPTGGRPGFSTNSITSFVNNGTLDIINDAAFVFPAGFVNQGTIIDSSVVRTKSVARSSTIMTLTIDSYTGHTYQLQKSTSPAGSTFGNVGAPQQGSTGNVLMFSDAGATGTKGFYRIAVDS